MKKHIIFLLYLFPLYLVAQPAPDFTFINAADGKEYTLYADFLDQDKTVVLDVFYTICPPCNAAAPFLEPLYRDWGGGYLDVEFIALSDKSFDSNEDVAAYKVAKGHSFLGAGNDGMGKDAANLFKSGTYGFWLGTPTFIVISPDGTVNFDVRGNSTSHTIELLDAAIEATGATRAIKAAGNILFDGAGIGQANVFLDGFENNTIQTDNTGTFTLNDLIIPDENYTLRVEKDINHDNGITTVDMIIMLKHILNIKPFDSPLQYIAADINHSNDITTLDMIKLRKLILQIDEHFVDNTSWRFIKANPSFEHPDNPYAEFDALEAEGFPFTSEDDISNLQITGVKIGDVNFSANPSQILSTAERNQETFSINIDNQLFNENELIQVQLKNLTQQTLLGYQMTLEFNPDYLELVSPTSGDLTNFSLENFNLKQAKQGIITTNWVNMETTNLAIDATLFGLKFKAKKSGQLNEVFRISSAATPAEAYNNDLDVMDMTLQFAPMNSDFDIKIQPNPVAQTAQLSYFLNQASSVDMQLFDITGRLLESFDLGLQNKGAQTFNLNMDNLAQGVYFIQMSRKSGDVETVRVLKH